MSLLGRIARWLGDLLAPAGAYKAEYCEDEPDTVAAERVYLIGEGGTPWSASLLCPCGCRETIRLSLLPNDRPRWRASVASGGAVTLHPSIWRVRGCRSHFFIRHGRVMWSRQAIAPPGTQRSPAGRRVDRRV